MKPVGLKLNKVWEIGLVVFSLALIGFVGNLGYRQTRVKSLPLAAGSSTGDSYIICAALRTVVERHYRGIRIRLLETGGTVENLRMLEDGRAALAVAQADVAAGPSARIVAVLYDDTFQLLKHRDSAIGNFAGLRGRTIALPQSGGQFQSFLVVAGHFGFRESDFRFIGSTDADADLAFADGRADALFRVRALANPSIERLVQTGNAAFLRIDHALAMKINHPAFVPATIPAGAYLGNPAVPPDDLPSISVHRTLLARAGADEEAVRDITEILFDYRQEIAQEISDQNAEMRLLLAQVRRPELQADLGPALHPGALQYYEKDKPPFIIAHADSTGLLLTVLVMIGSWIWQLRAWLQRQQKSIADRYSNRVVELIKKARATASPSTLDEIRAELVDLLTAAVGDLDADRLSEESFHSFRAILQIGLEVVKESRAVLLAAHG